MEDHGHIKIIISDSGEGCNMDLIEEGNGLKNIRDRTTEMGGSYSFKSAPGMGFSIEIFI
ncbi:MAG: hypothetical protein KDC53_21865 [Saprospiraceae bacterium]|nr:hypothetical protein [Saprospiraceae bacterium]